MTQSSSIRLSHHHYSDELISKGLATFSVKPNNIDHLEHGDVQLTFTSERSDMARAFGNHLLLLRVRVASQTSRSNNM